MTYPSRMSLTLVVGNKAYSSWSLRPWHLLRHGGVPFEEIVIPLYQEGSKPRILAHSPSGKVPALLDGDACIWDSLAICETLAERFPDRCGWPRDAAARAHARAVAAEMHSGFVALRTELPMNAREKRTGVTPSDDARADIARVADIWTGCRERWGAGGPWLFGAFSPADAMYAPVAIRFWCYDAALPAPAAVYRDTVLADPPIAEWMRAAREEKERLAKFERGTKAA
jgi:glutathione S-transferase